MSAIYKQGQFYGKEITVDNALNNTSENPLQNKVVTNALADKADLVGGKVPSTQLPSYVDDVVEGYYNETDGKFYEESTYTTEIVGEEGKIYVSLDTNYEYRWSGSAFVRVNEGVVLGETSSTAYRGDRGKIAYDDSQTNKTNIGDLTNLTTTATTDLVSAINEVNAKEAQTIQVDTMPIASETEEGKIYEYVGATDANYTNGYFYKCNRYSGTPQTHTKRLDTYATWGFTADIDQTVTLVRDAYGQGCKYYYINGTKYDGEYKDLSLPISRGDVIQFETQNQPMCTVTYYTQDTFDYQWDNINVQPNDGGQTIQVDTLPIASATEEGNIYEYVGATSGGLTNGYFYQCVETATAGTYEWVEKAIQGSGSGSLGKNITAAIDVGGVEAGDTFTQGTSYDDMWDALLNPTLYPTYTAPSASLTYSADAYYAVGSTIAAKVGYVDFDQGSIDIGGTEQAKRAGAATNYALASSGADTEYSDSSTSSGSFNVSALTRSTKGSITLTATVSYAAGPQPKDSKGNDYGTPLAAGSVTATKTMNFILPYRYGKSATSTISDFTGLSSDVKAKGQKTYKFTTNNEYMVMAYDSSYGNLTSILDGNGFETIGGWTKSSLTVDGFTYFVYISNSPTTDTNAPFTFKY